MNSLNNPAARLLALLREAQNYRGRPTKEALSGLLKIPNKDMPLLYSRLAKIVELPEQVKAQIILQNINHNMYLNWLPKIERSFSTLNFSAPFDNFLNNIDAVVLTELGFCSEHLSRNAPEFTISQKQQEEILKIQADIRKLIEEIEKSDVEVNIKRFMLDKLCMVHDALEEHIFLGVTPIKTTIESILGGILTNKELYEQATKTKQGKKFWKIVGKVALIINLITGPIQIAETTLHHLQETTESVDVNSSEVNPEEVQQATTC